MRPPDKLFAALARPAASLLLWVSAAPTDLVPRGELLVEGVVPVSDLDVDVQLDEAAVPWGNQAVPAVMQPHMSAAPEHRPPLA